MNKITYDLAKAYFHQKDNNSFVVKVVVEVFSDDVDSFWISQLIGAVNETGLSEVSVLPGPPKGPISFSIQLPPEVTQQQWDALKNRFEKAVAKADDWARERVVVLGRIKSLT
jgi:hypothetical protein